MWLAVATRPDITYTVGCLSSFIDCYRPEHWEAAIRVLHYLKGTRTHTLTLGGTGLLMLTGYSDSDYTNCINTSRSIGGYCFALGSGMVSWSSKKQPMVAGSSCYAEYIALHDAAHKIVFLRQLLKGLHLLPSDATLLFCNNDTASCLTEDHVWHSHTKHIHVKYHYTRKLVLSGDAAIKHAGSKDNIADILTKPLAHPDFQHLCHYLGVQPSTASGISKKSFQWFFRVKNQLKPAKTIKNPWKRWKPPITKNYYKFLPKPYWSDFVKNPKNVQKCSKHDNLCILTKKIKYIC
jgi:hypothetical protein